MTKTVTLPPAIVEILRRGGSLAVSISGGKDSQAMLYSLVKLHREQGYGGSIYAVHAHLGRAEWPQTLGHCRRIAAEAGVELVVVSRPQGDLLAEMRHRMATLVNTGKPHWPDARNRWCTAHQKQNQIDRDHRRHQLVVSAMGIRAEESPARARRATVSVRASITTARLKGASVDGALSDLRDGERLALDWLPLHGWTEADVWEACGTTLDDVNRRRELYRAGRHEDALWGFPAHPAYVFGNQRLSCALCVLASRNDILCGARHNPEIYREYVAMEEESGFRFRKDLSLSSLKPNRDDMEVSNGRQQGPRGQDAGRGPDRADPVALEGPRPPDRRDG